MARTCSTIFYCGGPFSLLPLQREDRENVLDHVIKARARMCQHILASAAEVSSPALFFTVTVILQNFCRCGYNVEGEYEASKTDKVAKRT